MVSKVVERFLSFVKKVVFLFCTVCVLFSGRSVLAAMSSTNYLLQWDALSTASSDTQSSSSYRLRSSGDFGVSADDLSSSSYALDGGFRGGIYDPVSTFQLFVQNVSSQVGATTSTSTSATVTSTSGFSVGDRILLVQNEGASQVSAMGKVTSIAGSVLNVDAFEGGSPSIDGSGGDYVYKMTTDGISLPLGTPSVSLVTTGIVAWEATADIQTGYSVYLIEDDDLKISGGSTLSDVTDGSVTAGSSEYGARSSDGSLAGSLFDTQDTAITTSPQLVASRAAVSFRARDLITLKLAMSSAQTAGAYSHNLTVLFSGNY